MKAEGSTISMLPHIGETSSHRRLWFVIKMAEMDIEDPTHVGLDVCKRLKKQWGPLSPYWPEDEE